MATLTTRILHSPARAPDHRLPAGAGHPLLGPTRRRPRHARRRRLHRRADLERWPWSASCCSPASSPQLIPGRRIPLVTELPPMRLPIAGNVLKKTGGRLKWYLIEVIPLFLLGTFIMFAARQARHPAGHHQGRRTAGHRLARPAQGSLGRLRHGLPAPRLRRHRPVRHGRCALPDPGGGRHDHHHPVHPLLRQPADDGQGAGPAKIAARMVLAIIVPFAFLVGGLFNLALRALWYGA
jgi:ferrous iron transport protein B